MTAILSNFKGENFYFGLEYPSHDFLEGRKKVFYTKRW